MPRLAPLGRRSKEKAVSGDRKFSNHPDSDSEAPSSREKDLPGEEPCCELDSMPKLTAGQRVERSGQSEGMRTRVRRMLVVKVGPEEGGGRKRVEEEPIYLCQDPWAIP